MQLTSYRGRHLRPRPKRRGPVVVGTAAVLWASQSAAHAGEHVVAKGETLSEIAVRYGTTAAAIARANGLANPNLVVAGTSLTIPSGGGSSPGSGGGGVHTVRAGETLWDLAQRFGTSVDALARVNGISNPNFVVAGTTIKLGSSGGGGGISSGGSSSHTVQAGETLSEVAARYGVSVASLAAANGISNPNFVVADTTVSIPRGGAPSPTVAPTPTSSADIGYLLEQEALANGISTSLIKAIAYQESGWQPHVVSSAGAIGVMQVMPDTADWVNQVLLGGTSLNVKDPGDNIKMGVSYLRYLLSIMPSQEQALAAYYSGPGNVGSKLHGYQRDYVNAVMAHTARF